MKFAVLLLSTRAKQKIFRVDCGIDPPAGACTRSCDGQPRHVRAAVGPSSPPRHAAQLIARPPRSNLHSNVDRLPAEDEKNPFYVLLRVLLRRALTHCVFIIAG
jgi:hypothetical protein